MLILPVYTPPNAALRGCYVYDEQSGEARHVMQGIYDSVSGEAKRVDN
jgi:cysteine dioxygenase